MKRSKIILATFFLFFISFGVIAQTKTVSGKVLNEHLDPLSGVFIQTLDLRFNTKTDENGNYSIKIPIETYELKVECIAQEAETFKILNNCVFNIILLDDIIVEFETSDEHLKDYDRRKKEIEKKYKKAIEEGLFKKNQPCS